MLRFLRIRQLAVIDAVEVEFDPGLNVLTGETGAGKSILVEAVGLLLGARASGDLVRTGQELATISNLYAYRNTGPKEQQGAHEIVTQYRRGGEGYEQEHQFRVAMPGARQSRSVRFQLLDDLPTAMLVSGFAVRSADVVIARMGESGGT